MEFRIKNEVSSLIPAFADFIFYSPRSFRSSHDAEKRNRCPPDLVVKVYAMEHKHESFDKLAVMCKNERESLVDVIDTSKKDQTNRFSSCNY